VNVNRGTTEAKTLFSQINDDLNTQKTRTDRHRKLLVQYGNRLCDLKEINHDLGSCVVVLEEESRVCEAQVDGLVNSVDELRAIINSMMDQLCHCSDGKGKKREVDVKIEEESEELEYTSEGEYRTVPGTGEVMVTELIPIEQDLESRGIPSEVQEACGCGLPDHPIEISDHAVTVAENIIPVRIQVERSSPEDRVVSLPPIPTSKPSHIADIPVNLQSHYTMAKAIERKRQGEELVEWEREASLGFADWDSDSGSDSRVPRSSRRDPPRMFPTLGAKGHLPSGYSMSSLWVL